MAKCFRRAAWAHWLNKAERGLFSRDGPPSRIPAEGGITRPARIVAQQSPLWPLHRLWGLQEGPRQLRRASSQERPVRLRPSLRVREPLQYIQQKKAPSPRLDDTILPKSFTCQAPHAAGLVRPGPFKCSSLPRGAGISATGNFITQALELLPKGIAGRAKQAFRAWALVTQPNSPDFP